MIAIVGMACHYPDARSPQELWENVLAGRRAFRRMPSERLHLGDFYSPDRSVPDATYATQAAVLEGYEFDRVKFRQAASTVRAADPAHWLALDIAERALADAGFVGGEGLPREATGVLLGNTLTGEVSRANGLRLRWPYVRRVVAAALAEEGWEAERSGAFLEQLEQDYKRAFEAVGEETLAGGLANTIAGRICNYFDLHGGGFIVDGACASSLLAASQACSALVAGDWDVALAGGVDLSLDPFELVGFAKVGALAEDTMRVYDARSDGFLPGEGCGFVVLMRAADALAEGRRIRGFIRGWGISSDGHGGITRPEVEGQRLALSRAYRRAGFGIDSVNYFEGHGTGTDVGDATELEALSAARRQAGPESGRAALGSIKANIGHTKAAAGVAGLIKATLALEARLLPPHTGCEDPHPRLAGDDAALRVLPPGSAEPAAARMRAGVSAMGFGGINAHLVLESTAGERSPGLTRDERRLLATPQDAELFLFAGRDAEDLAGQIERLSKLAPRVSSAELTDLAAELGRRLGDGPLRAALVAARPADLAARLEALGSWLREGVAERLRPDVGLFLGNALRPPRIGFLFSGQGSPAHLGGGSWRRRFESVGERYRHLGIRAEDAPDDGVATEVAQPAIVTASVAALEVLRELGIEARVAIGHSLGELTALHWAGGCTADELVELARVRGRAMAEAGEPGGAMATLEASPDEAAAWSRGAEVVIACHNAPRQTVISGPAAAVAEVADRARRRGRRATELEVSHAFHSPMVAAAAVPLEKALESRPLRPLTRRVFSTVSGAELAEADPRQLLIRQITSPVRFTDAVSAAAGEADLWLEVGPGRSLAGLLRESSDVPAAPLDAGGKSLVPLLRAIGMAWVLGTPIRHRELFAARFTRPFDLDWKPRFLINPCELAPLPDTARRRPQVAAAAGSEPRQPAKSRQALDVPAPADGAAESALDVVRQLVVERTELPAATVRGGDRLLSDLHLSSIAVGQMAAEAARRLGLAPPTAPTDYADATVEGVAQSLEALRTTGGMPEEDPRQRPPQGVGEWVRPFTVEWVERPRPAAAPPPAAAGEWRLLAPPEHPLAEPLTQALDGVAGGGIALCLPPRPRQECVDLMLRAARAAVSQRPQRIVVAHHGGGGGFARTLHLETGIPAAVVEVPTGQAEAAAWIACETRAAAGYTETRYDARGVRRQPVLRLLPEEAAGDVPLGSGDVLLVSGGGKGIAAECALALARQTGVRLALLGRSRPEADAELAGNLERLRAAGAEVRYASADVTDAAAVAAAVRRLEAELGEVTALLHGAGINQPKLLTDLDAADFRRTLAPKLDGLRHLLAALAPERLRLLVTFGSIIARTGMRGEADYAVANEWLADEVERFGERFPECRCLNVEWSVWSGVGMGERLGRVDALVREGISPISPDEGVAVLGRLLARRLPDPSVVVSGRFGELPTLGLERPELPFLRFLEQPRIYFPGVELVSDAELSAESDPYLEDHVLGGERLFPAVLGLEAMAQVAMALTGSASPPTFEDVRFERPVAVSAGQRLTIRVAALVREPGLVEAVVESESTAFQAAHFRARCRFGEPGGDAPAAPLAEPATSRLAIDPERDLYGGLLFQDGRFRRLAGYRALRATECLAEIRPAAAGEWFHAYLPGELLLGDPGARDAAIHAIQASIPHATVLPVGVGRLSPATAAAGAVCLVAGRERRRQGNHFVWDLELMDAEGTVVERWQELALRAVEKLPAPPAWPAALLLPHVERRLEDLLAGVGLAATFERAGGGERREHSAAALRRLLGPDVEIRYRGDGKPEVVTGGRQVSVAHADPWLLAVAGEGPLGCDLEVVESRPWADLLGGERLQLARVLAAEHGESEDRAATRVWAAGECLKKAGAGAAAPLQLDAAGADGWVVLTSGALAIATLVADLRETQTPLVLAVLASREAAPAPTAQRPVDLALS